MLRRNAGLVGPARQRDLRGRHTGAVRGPRRLGRGWRPPAARPRLSRHGDGERGLPGGQPPAGPGAARTSTPPPLLHAPVPGRHSRHSGSSLRRGRVRCAGVCCRCPRLAALGVPAPGRWPVAVDRHGAQGCRTSSSGVALAARGCARRGGAGWAAVGDAAAARVPSRAGDGGGRQPQRADVRGAGGAGRARAGARGTTAATTPTGTTARVPRGPTLDGGGDPAGDAAPRRRSGSRRPSAASQWAGFGAFDLARLHPKRFCAVGGHSPAIWTSSGQTAPGAFDNASDFARNDIVRVARSTPSAFAGKPLWLDAGGGNPFEPGPAGGLHRRACAHAASRLRSTAGQAATAGAYWRSHWKSYLGFYARALAHCG